jgi:CRP/FNR family cyclic AMP-dependent transcriptional regulator
MRQMGRRGPLRTLCGDILSGYDLKTVLAQHFLLKDLSPEDLERVQELAATRWYRPGQSVFMKGDPGTALMAVLSGRVRICAYSADGREVVLNVISPGEVFGEIALIDGGERTADAFAMEPTELLILGRREFLPYLQRNPNVCIKLLTIMCQRLRSTSEQLEDFNFLDLRCRLAKRLLFLSAIHGETTARGIHIGVRLPQHLLASMIGTSREAVNKQLRTWEESGLIDVKRGSITVRDRRGLERIISDTACASVQALIEGAHEPYDVP